MKLTKTQEQVLMLLGKSPLAKKFYWTGGTLLASMLLHDVKVLFSQLSWSSSIIKR